MRRFLVTGSPARRLVEGSLAIEAHQDGLADQRANLEHLPVAVRDDEMVTGACDPDPAIMRGGTATLHGTVKMESALKQANHVQLRALGAEDLAAAHGLSTTVGWPHRLEDWQLVHKIGHGIAAIDRDGALAGTAMWWPFGEAFATIGMVIVSPARQGGRIGRRLMDAALASIGRRAAQLNATEEGLRLYDATGFTAIGGVRQHQGMPRRRAAESIIERGATRPITAADSDAIHRIDRAATGVPRDVLLDALWQAGDGLILERSGVPVGFAFRRPFGRGEVVGPVVAADEVDALALVAPLVVSARAFARVDVVAEAGQLASWLESAGLPRVGAVTTMVRGERPARDAGLTVYGIANQALG